MSLAIRNLLVEQPSCANLINESDSRAFSNEFTRRFRDLFGDSFLLAIYLLCAGSLLAQTKIHQYSGKVVDPSGLPVKQASICLASRDSTAFFTTVSNGRGEFNLTLPAGDYLLDVQAPGLELANAPNPLPLFESRRQTIELTLRQPSSNILVTAAGTAQSLDETAKTISIVSRSEVDIRGLESTTDALRQTPGLLVSQLGGPGSFATVQVRGLRSFDTSVLIDGMRFRDVGATQADASSFLSDLLLVDENRIEVLRGAGSSLYGTNAIGGVINIVTDNGSGPFHGSLTADGGGLGEFRGLARFGAGVFHDRLHFSAGLGHQDVTAGVADHGRYRNTTGNGLIDYAFRPGLVLSSRLLATDVFGQLSSDPSTPPSGLPLSGRIPAIALSDSQLKLVEAGLPYSTGNATFIPDLGDGDYFRTARFVSSMTALQHQVSAPFSYRIAYQALISNRDVVNGPSGVGPYQPLFRTSDQFNGRIDTLQARVNYRAGSNNLITSSYEFERESFDSPSVDNNPDLSQRIDSRSQAAESSHAVDAQDQVRFFHDRLQILVSGRYQHFTLSKPIFSGSVPVYASATSVSPPSAYTGDVSIAYFLRSTGTKIRSHSGNGYRKPSLYELFGTSFYGPSFSAYGDPRLKPERSVAIDGGIDQYFASDRVRLSATYFYTRLQQVIGFDFSGLINPLTDPFGRSLGYFNTGGGMARGVEASAEVKLSRGTRVQSSYTYTNARDRISRFGDGTLQTPRVVPHSFSLVILQQLGSRLDASLDLISTSKYLYPFNALTVVFPGQRQLGMSLGYTQPFSDWLKLRFYTRISNLTDQTFYDDGFRTPGRWATVGTTFSF